MLSSLSSSSSSSSFRRASSATSSSSAPARLFRVGCCGFSRQNFVPSSDIFGSNVILNTHSNLRFFIFPPFQTCKQTERQSTPRPNFWNVVLFIRRYEIIAALGRWSLHRRIFYRTSPSPPRTSHSVPSWTVCVVCCIVWWQSVLLKQRLVKPTESPESQHATWGPPRRPIGRSALRPPPSKGHRRRRAATLQRVLPPGRSCL